MKEKNDVYFGNILEIMQIFQMLTHFIVYYQGKSHLLKSSLMLSEKFLSIEKLSNLWW